LAVRIAVAIWHGEREACPAVVSLAAGSELIHAQPVEQ
jgi:hypothetical protein